LCRNESGQFGKTLKLDPELKHYTTPADFLNGAPNKPNKPESIEKHANSVQSIDSRVKDYPLALFLIA
jgi:hypothetical protein